MSTAQYNAWVNSGRHWQAACPVADLAATLNRHGFQVGIIGDSSHLLAATPEDHTPYSATGWPGRAPTGWVFALDIMPGGAVPLGKLAAQLVDDRCNAVAGAAPIKYMNWAPDGGSCRHDSWEPGHVTHSSSDVGHIHISMRTDYQTSHVMSGYDPVAALLGGHPPSPPPPPPQPQPVDQAPLWPGRVLSYRAGQAMMQGTDVRQAQQRLATRGWTITADGWYGQQSDAVTRQFQADSTTHDWPLQVDGQIGAKTWYALWHRPVS